MERTKAGVTATKDVDLAQVLVYRLVKPYDPARFAAVTRELDQRAEQLAEQLSGGRVVSRSTSTVADRKVRSYRLQFDEKGSARTEEIAFVLQDETEYFLLCRRQTDGSDTDCARLFATFALR